MTKSFSVPWPLANFIPSTLAPQHIQSLGGSIARGIEPGNALIAVEPGALTAHIPPRPGNGALYRLIPREFAALGLKYLGIADGAASGGISHQALSWEILHFLDKPTLKHLARAQIAGMNVGSLKILFHRDTLQILGIHCFGERAAEIIHIGQAIMEQKGEGNTIEYFVNTTFNYPTMAEAYRVAALNGLNRLF